jgi:small subunit ribosomal protein S13
MNKKLLSPTTYRIVLKNTGIGLSRALRLHKSLGLNLRHFPKKLKKKQIKKLNGKLKRLCLNKNLKQRQKSIFQYQFKIRHYRSVRTKAGLPCRGQRTRTNAKTKKKMVFKNFNKPSKSIKP